MSERAKAIGSALVILIVQFAGIFNLYLDAESVSAVITSILMLASVIYGIWKNHNFTKEAGIAQKILNAIKGEEADPEIVAATNVIVKTLEDSPEV